MSALAPHYGENDRRGSSRVRGRGAGRGPGRGRGQGCGRGRRRVDPRGDHGGVTSAVVAPLRERPATPVEVVERPSPSGGAIAEDAASTPTAPTSEMVAIVSSPDDCLLCGACETSCPTGAISARDRLLIDESLCSGCGTCVDLCVREVLTLARR
jgi:ferredoxin